MVAPKCAAALLHLSQGNSPIHIQDATPTHHPVVVVSAYPGFPAVQLEAVPERDGRLQAGSQTQVEIPFRDLPRSDAGDGVEHWDHPAQPAE